MGVRARLLRVVALALLAAALAGGTCGGGGETHTFSADDRNQERSTAASAGAQVPQPVPSHARAAWPHAKVLRSIAGEVVRIDGRRVRVDRATVTCGGDGPGSRRGRQLVWERFTCIQPTFGADGAPGPDAVFGVQPTGPRSFRIVDQRFTRY